LIPGLVNTHGFINDEMILLDAMDVQDGRIVHSEVTSVTGIKRANTTAAVGMAVGPLLPGMCRS
jgi:hypothetical protein